MTTLSRIRKEVYDRTRKGLNTTDIYLGRQEWRELIVDPSATAFLITCTDTSTLLDGVPTWKVDELSHFNITGAPW